MTVLRICFIGDSITNGTADPDYRGWPGSLCAAESAAGHDVTLYNLGVRGDTSALVAARWRAEAEARLPPEVPGALVFAFGVNDAADEIGGGIRVPVEESVTIARAMLGEAAAWLPCLWLGPAPIDEAQQPMRPYPGVTFDFRNRRIAALNNAYRHLAGEMALPYLDLFTPLAEDPDWARAAAAGDGVHPTPAGYRMLAGMVGAWPAWRAWFDG